MADTVEQITSRARSVYEQFEKELERVKRIDCYLRGDHDRPFTPKQTTEEYRLLQKRSISNWLPLVVDVMAQPLYVEGYRASKASENSTVWDEAWQPNGLDSRQTAVYRSALSFGLAYVTVLPGDTAPKIRGSSPRRMIAVYDDPADDIWPRYALQVIPNGDSKTTWRLFDAQQVHYFTGDSGSPKFVKSEQHDVGVCPVIRFSDNMDLDGRARGEVEPLIPIQDRINQTAFDLLIAQTYGSFKVRTVTGMEITLGPDGKPVDMVELSAKRLLVSPDKDVKFGTLEETNLDGYLASKEQSVRDMAAISQTPPHNLLGQMANLSAEALVAAETGRERKSDGHRHSFGESWEQALRLAAKVGKIDGAEDESSQVMWKGSEARSLAATADALGKIATQLGVPVEALWEMIPGVTTTDITRWKAMKQESDALSQLTNLLNSQAQPPEPAPAPAPAQ